MLRRRKTEMLLALLILQLLLIVVVLALYLRKPPVPAADPRQLALPDQITRLDSRSEALERYVHTGLTQIRADLTAEASATRQANEAAAAALRGEVLQTIQHLGSTLTTGLDSFRTDNKASAETLRATVQQTLELLTQRFAAFSVDTASKQLEAQSALHEKLSRLTSTNAELQEKLRGTVEASLSKLNSDNTAKLEEMRATVDEKLHATLHTRLTESFGQVTDQLNKVHAGLGEMSKLSEGVDDLSRIFSNVKSRGGFAEVQLGMLLDQMLAPSQFVRNAKVRPNTQEVVEFAVRFPGQSGETLLPIDAKFPREDWERLESAYAANDPELLAAAGKAFEAAIRTEGKRICEKYINPPVTTPHAIMFLPTEGLYAEVMRRDALQSEIQSKCQVTIAGPSTLSAILTSFQMGFHMLALQEKGDEVWKVLESAKTEFGKFGKLMDKVEGDVGKIQKTLGEVGVRTRAINRTLREVSDTTVTNGTLDFEDLASNTLRLAAVADEE
jgi:DNA recombination protein RmuC